MPIQAFPSFFTCNIENMGVWYEATVIMVLLLTCASVVLYAAESSLYTPAVTDSYVLESPDAASSK